MRGRSLRVDRRGVAALEFALCAPLLILLLVGGFQVTSLMRQDSRLGEAGEALAETLAEQSSISPTGSVLSANDICSGTSKIMLPFPAQSFSAAIASVSRASSSNGGKAAVDWELDAACPTAAAALGSSAITLATSPTNLVPNAGDSVLVVRIAYQDKSLISPYLPTGMLRTRTIFARPRSGTTMPCSSC